MCLRNRNGAVNKILALERQIRAFLLFWSGQFSLIQNLFRCKQIKHTRIALAILSISVQHADVHWAPSSICSLNQFRMDEVSEFSNTSFGVILRNRKGVD